MTGKLRNIVLYGAIFSVTWGAAGRVLAEAGKSFSFGVIADIQAGDKETKIGRYYRESFARLEECVSELNRHDLAFTIELGDLIDGNAEKTASDLDRVMEEYSKLSMPTYHVLGNHGMSSVRNLMSRKLNSNVFYYDFTVPAAEGWRFIVLDGNDAGYGVLGSKQLEWLKSKLDQARADQEKIILFNHFALLESAAPQVRMKTPEPVLGWINESGCVVAYFAGHDHAGGYACQNGIHHITVKGMVEAPVKNAYAVIEVYSDKLVEIGFGKEPSRKMKFK
ncbi:MAG: hypothetical protein DRP64_16585 [Verrucomicrobia bacterium]|nr:MAG: hypothetical protein DRP64_16585 [Verrucomicrobiota bacterium]